jgi:transposase
MKDFRRIATRYDKLAANFLSAVALAPPSHSGYDGMRGKRSS